MEHAILKPLEILIVGDGDKLPIPHLCRKVATRLSSYYMPAQLKSLANKPTRGTKILIDRKCSYKITPDEASRYAMVIYIPLVSSTPPEMEWLATHYYLVGLCAMLDNLFVVDATDTREVERVLTDLIANNALRLSIEKEDKKGK